MYIWRKKKASDAGNLGIVPLCALPSEYALRERIAVLIAAGALAVISVANWHGFVYPFYAGGIAFQVSALLLLLLAASPAKTSGYGARGAIVYLFVAYASYTAASCAWSGHARLSAIGSLHSIFAVGWAVLLAALIRRPPELRLLMRGLFFAGVLAGLMAILLVAMVVWYCGIIPGILDVVEQVQGHRNFLAIFLLPPLILGLADIATPVFLKGRPRGRSLHLPLPVVMGGVMIMLAAFAMCKAWGGLVGLAAGIICILLAFATRKIRFFVLIAAVCAALGVVVALSLPPVTQALMKHPQATRWFMWQGAVGMFAEHPVEGWGVGMFLFNFADYKPTDVMKHGWLTSITLHPHNELLLILVEGGILGLMLYLAAHFLAVRKLLKKAQTCDPAGRMALWALFGTLVAMFLHGMVEVALRYWAPSAAYWTVIGLVIAAGRDGAAESGTNANIENRKFLAFAPVAVAVVVSLLIGAYVIFPGAKAEWLMRGGLPVSNKVSDHTDNYLRASQLSRYLPDYLVALRQRADIYYGCNMADAAIEAYSQIADVAPGYGPVRRILARLHTERANRLSGVDMSLAVQEIRKARDFASGAVAQNPNDPSAHLALAQALSALPLETDVAGALEHARTAATLAPQRADIRYVHGILLGRSGDRMGACQELREASALYAPDSPMQARITAALRNLD